jgi:hypothetical protein
MDFDELRSGNEIDLPAAIWVLIHISALIL